MTARKPATFYDDEKEYETEQSRSLLGVPDFSGAALPQSKTNPSSEPLHPLLTDFGPYSATCFTRPARDNSSFAAGEKRSRRTQPRPGFQRLVGQSLQVTPSITSKEINSEGDHFSTDDHKSVNELGSKTHSATIVPDLPSSPRDLRRVGLKCGWPAELPVECLDVICQCLSHDEVRNLRLVSRWSAVYLAPILFRTVVTDFGASMFEITTDVQGQNLSTDSPLRKFGEDINKFGVSFEVDLEGLQTAREKTISGTVDAWWGQYRWPLLVYPRFEKLEALENLVENMSLLKSAMSELFRATELALSIDSGYGWLNGPDISDMAVWNMRCSKGTPVFGKTFSAEDKWQNLERNEMVKEAQINTIKEAICSLKSKSGEPTRYLVQKINFLENILVREYDDFRSQAKQPDFDSHKHTGGRREGPGWNPIGAMPAIYGPVSSALSGTTSRPVRTVRDRRLLPQWPLIFNGYDLAAYLGGNCDGVQRKLARPQVFPLQPGKLTEAQAQWLMETAWAQRAFISAYKTGVLHNRAVFNKVHSLHIAKLSSGLLPSFEHTKFWSALPGLKKLTILVSPDWRTEHLVGDPAYESNMLISPASASVRFAWFLRQYIMPIAHLDTLKIGFVGGGEHATGICARNQHVLPAPITCNPRSWVVGQDDADDSHHILVFEHVKNLTIENAWFSPSMLEAFMDNSKDTSLASLCLKSVSLTTVHGAHGTLHLTTIGDGLKPRRSRRDWLLEKLPSNHCWPAVIDRIAPGDTFTDRKYNTGLIDAALTPRTPTPFRGNVCKISFESCGYVKISGFLDAQFNQNDLVMPTNDAMDEGLVDRARTLRGIPKPSDDRHVAVTSIWHGPAVGVGATNNNTPAPSNDNNDNKKDIKPVAVMMSEKDPDGIAWPLLGKLTQCIHPIEKRVLEQAWGMEFGWGNNMRRWEAVEDGFFEGGTGRFTGVVRK